MPLRLSTRHLPAPPAQRRSRRLPICTTRIRRTIRICRLTPLAERLGLSLSLCLGLRQRNERPTQLAQIRWRPTFRSHPPMTTPATSVSVVLSISHAPSFQLLLFDCTAGHSHQPCRTAAHTQHLPSSGIRCAYAAVNEVCSFHNTDRTNPLPGGCYRRPLSSQPTIPAVTTSTVAVGNIGSTNTHTARA